uniref:DUF4587 domain-containing protein n=1 Tax=Hucho hucho TaxID=62062 RepID=A0A4W5N8K8_9TELE
MAWTDDTYPQFQNVQIIQQPASQQPTTILQQLPAAMSSPTPSIQPGDVKQDLVELRMIQNAQMHQVIMNNMTMSALSSFGYSQPQLHPTSTSEVQSFGYSQSQPKPHPPPLRYIYC